MLPYDTYWLLRLGSLAATLAATLAAIRVKFVDYRLTKVMSINYPTRAPYSIHIVYVPTLGNE
jgi:hypothetical protein